MSFMAMNRVNSSLRGAERRTGVNGAANTQPAHADRVPYPTFPDKSKFPVVFPQLPPATDGGPRRPPKHVSLADPPYIPDDQKPQHVALVMDGNGRWATQRGLHRTEGHKMGEAVLIDVTCGAIELGIKWLTVYAFSTENWKRSPEEVRFLMGFNRDVVRRRREVLHQMGVRMRWAGQRPRMWRSVIKELEIAERLTLNNDVITVTYCVNYGGRAEIADATRDIARQVATGQLNPDRINEETIGRHLHYPDMPDVDLFLRTSGEQRSSNFLIWQSAYAEYVFQDKLFPDYDRRDLWNACLEYAERNRRYGGT
jgi:trans,polycis-decaprenyl diphosphate synthase